VCSFEKAKTSKAFPSGGRWRRKATDEVLLSISANRRMCAKLFYKRLIHHFAALRHNVPPSPTGEG